jgi:hypothetical protein
LLIVLNLNVLFNVLKPAYSETNLKEAVDQPMFCCPTAQINSSSTLGQTFVSPRDNLCTIRVMFSCETNQKRGEITFVLREAGNNEKVLYRMKYPLKKIENSTRCYFIFPPIKNSSGKKYIFSFTSPSLPGGKGVSLWYESKDCYPDGSMLVNNEPAAGDLYFTAYYFTGKYPKTVWEGKKQTVINQGTYVNLRELQFYHERSKDFREKTITHEKIMRFTKAQKKRIQGDSPLKD